MFYNADLHIHSVLSPCADFLMGYKNIIKALIDNDIKIFSITDHNCYKNSRVFKEKGEEAGLVFIPGMEVQSAEEIHIAVYFPDMEKLTLFGDEILKSLPPIKNKEEVFGYQLIIDENDDYIEKEEAFLAGASSYGIDEIAVNVKKYKGIIVPAHLDRSNSIISNLGYIPEIDFDAFEIYNLEKVQEIRDKYKLEKPILSSSDAHFPTTMGKAKMEIDIESFSAEDVIEAIKRGNVRIKNGV